MFAPPARRFRTAVTQAQYDDEKVALTGRLSDDGLTVILTDDTLGPNEIFVRLNGNNSEVRIIYNVQVSMFHPGVWVALKPTPDGNYEISRPLARRNTEAFGVGAPIAASPTRPGEAIREIIPADNLKPFRMRKSPNGGLKVIIEAGWHRGGFWDGLGDIDLTNHRPTTANTQAWVRAGIDTITNQPVVVTGPEYSTGLILSENLITEVELPNTVEPSGAVVLTDVQSTITSNDDIVDTRRFVHSEPFIGYPSVIERTFYAPVDRNTVLFGHIDASSGHLVAEEGRVIATSFPVGEGGAGAGGGDVSQLTDLTDVSSAAQTANFVLAAGDGSVGGDYRGRLLVANDIPGTLNGTVIDGNLSVNNSTFLALPVSVPIDASILKIQVGSTVFNEGGANHDHRFEGDTEPNLFVIDASADAVGIGTSTPSGFQVTLPVSLTARGVDNVRLGIDAAGSPVVVLEDSGSQQWNLAVASGSLRIVETNVAARMTIASGGLVTIINNATIGDGTGSKQLIINGAAGNVRRIIAQSNGSARWVMSMANSTAEAGSNAGSDFVIQSFDDTGAFLRNDLILTRSNGNWQIGGSVGLGGLHASALLRLASTTKGFGLMPMTTTERDNIASPIAGLMIFNTTTGLINVHDGTNWKAVGA